MGLTWLRDPGFACNSAISQSRSTSAFFWRSGRDENLEEFINHRENGGVHPRKLTWNPEVLPYSLLR